MSHVRRTIAVLSFLALAPLAPLAGLTGTAHAATVACGQTITQSTVLDADVGPCPANGANGIVVGADNITLDLNGFSVIGSPGPGDGAGVYLLGRRGVTVRNGTVRSFDGGVAIEGGGNNTVTKIAARDNIGVVGSTRYDDGIAILSSSNNRVIGNLAVHNGPLSGIAIYSRVDVEHQRATSGASTGNLIDMNRVVDTNLARSPSINDSDGIRIETLSVFNTISNNSVTGSGLDGISLFSFAPDNVVRHNVSTNNGFLNPAARRGDGIRVFGGSDRSTVEDNIVTGNAANGIILHGQFNARPPVMDSRVVNNYAVDNNRLPPIGPGPLGGPTFDIQDGSPTCDNNVWFGNTFHTASPACTTAGGHPV